MNKYCNIISKEFIRNKDLQSNWWIVLHLLTFVFCSFTRVGAIKEFTIEKLNSYHSKDELKWEIISFKDIIVKVLLISNLSWLWNVFLFQDYLKQQVDDKDIEHIFQGINYTIKHSL